MIACMWFTCGTIQCSATDAIRQPLNGDQVASHARKALPTPRDLAATDQLLKTILPYRDCLLPTAGERHWRARLHKRGADRTHSRVP
jgi:hypothetical protein